jgi:hypothetical protein
MEEDDDDDNNNNNNYYYYYYYYYGVFCPGVGKVKTLNEELLIMLGHVNEV